jgi:hypothetical protein
MFPFILRQQHEVRLTSMSSIVSLVTSCPSLSIPVHPHHRRLERESRQVSLIACDYECKTERIMNFPLLLQLFNHVVMC